MRRIMAGMVAAPLALLFGTGASVVASVETGTSPCGLTAFGKYFYVDNYSDATIVRIDPATNTIVKRGHGGAASCGLAVGAGAIWVENFYPGTITRVNPVTLKPTNRIKVGNHPWDVAFGFGAVWA
jgi:DNA-binding beta-propeller fold protein YncE